MKEAASLRALTPVMSKEATAAYEEVVAFTAQLGARHTKTLGAKYNLANLLMEAGDMDKAKTLYQEVVAGRAAIGAEHTLDAK